MSSLDRGSLTTMIMLVSRFTIAPTGSREILNQKKDTINMETSVHQNSRCLPLTEVVTREMGQLMVHMILTLMDLEMRMTKIIEERTVIVSLRREIKRTETPLKRIIQMTVRDHLETESVLARIRKQSNMADTTELHLHDIRIGS